VAWDAADFAVFFALVAGVGVSYTLVARKTRNIAYRSGVAATLAATFLLIWVNGAVGIIASEDNDANLMFFGVLAVGLIGALVTRFEPRGMRRALIATAVAQALVAVIALVGDLGSGGAAWPKDVLFATGFFGALWLLSAWLFGRTVR